MRPAREASRSTRRPCPRRRSARATACALAAAVAVAGLPPRASRADAPASLDLTSLRAHVSAAMGTRPARLRETIAFHADDGDGRTVVTHVGSDVRVDRTFGPFTSARGSYRGQAWHRNENGETVLEQPDPGKATADPTTTTLIRGSAPGAPYVIATLDAKGYGTKTFVDPATYRIVRRITIGPAQNTVVAYDDFRTTAGYTQPWHWTTRNGFASDDGDNRIVAETTQVDDAGVKIAEPTRSLVEFPAGKTTVELPVHEERGAFIVRVMVAGRGLDFELDTGAGGIVIDDDVARRLGLQEYGNVSSGVNAGRVDERRAVVPRMDVGPLTMHDVVVETIPHSAEAPGKYRVVGLLGFDFIGALTLDLDYAHGRVTATDGNAFVPPRGTRVYAVPVRLGGQVPLADVTVDGALGERFIVDTGAAGTMLFFDYFARRHPEAFRQVDFGAPALNFEGVGGAFDARAYRLADVHLGGIVFKQFVGYRVLSRGAYGGDDDGALGSVFLSYFDVVIDYADSTIYFVPYS